MVERTVIDGVDYHAVTTMPFMTPAHWQWRWRAERWIKKQRKAEARAARRRTEPMAA